MGRTILVALFLLSFLAAGCAGFCSPEGCPTLTGVTAITTLEGQANATMMRASLLAMGAGVENGTGERFAVGWGERFYVYRCEPAPESWCVSLTVPAKADYGPWRSLSQVEEAAWAPHQERYENFVSALERHSGLHRAGPPAFWHAVAT